MAYIARLLLWCSLLFSTSAFATVNVVRFPSGTPVAVCQASDTNANCGGSGSGVANENTIHQVAHGFSVGQAIRLSGSATYTLAKADNVTDAEVVGIVSVVTDADNFKVITGGYITGLSGLTANTNYYVSESVAGGLTSTEPSVAGQVSKPILNAATTTTGYVFNMRGMVIGSAGANLGVGTANLPVVYTSATTAGPANGIVFLPNGNVGLGSATPGTVLDIQGSLRQSTNPTNCSSGSYPLGIDGSLNVEGCTVATTGTVTSIATTAPITGGIITGTGTIGINTTGTWNGNSVTATLASTVTTNANLTGEVTSVGNAATISDNVTVTGWDLGDSVSTTLKNSGNMGIGTTLISDGRLIVRGGNVGVGTDHPGAALDVNGTSRMTGFQLSTNPSAGFILTSNTVGIGTWVAAPAGGGGGATAAGGLNEIQYNAPIGTLAASNKFTMNGTNVGIGTTNGKAALEITSIGSGAIFQVSASSADNGSYLKIPVSGNIGIGTQNPGVPLDVAGNIRLAGNGSQMFFGNDGKNYITDSASTNADMKLISGNTEQMRLQNTNLVPYFPTNIGIGTVLPRSAEGVSGLVLDVAGNTQSQLLLHSIGSPSELLLMNSGGSYFMDLLGNSTVTKNALIIRNTTTANDYSPTTIFKLESNGHINTSGTIPTIASNACGSTSQGTVTTKSTDNSGSVTVGTLTVTSCAMTFNTAWTNSPNCVATDDSNIIAIKAAATSSTLTFSSVASMSGDIISYICQGNI